MLEGCLSAFMLDDLIVLGRPSCIRTTFLDLDDTMNKTRDSPIFGSPSCLNLDSIHKSIYHLIKVNKCLDFNQTRLTFSSALSVDTH